MDYKQTIIKYLRLAKENSATRLRSLKASYREKNAHSRVVFVLKAALPSAVALFLGAMLIAPEFDELRKIKIDVPKLESADKISFTMDNGTFYGQGNDGMVFSLTIDNFKENRVDDIMMFSKISGKVFLKDASWLDIKTTEGQYANRDKLVTMTGDVKFSDDQGSKVETSEAIIDLESAEVRGTAPIRASTQFGTVAGDGFAFKRNEKYIFTGRVRAVIDSSKLK
jgi:hypothetical protein